MQAETPLNTQDVTRMTGATRRMLDHYEVTGLLTPSRAGGHARSKRQWSVDQAKFAERVRILQHGSRGLDEIASLADEGAESFLGELACQCSRDIRSAWRELKSATLDSRRCEAARLLGPREGLYLRLLPQRWYALVPAEIGNTVFPPLDKLGASFVGLHTVSQVVGWCTAGASGVLASISRPALDSLADGLPDGVSRYAYIELATPPMPAPSAGMPHDGGCYCDVVGEGAWMPECHGESCALCSRYGRPPTTEERFHWKTSENISGDLWARTLMADDMDEPYAYGIWSEHDHLDDGTWDLSSLRPRLMPHRARFPLGVTASSMPSGAYLCLQTGGSDVTAALEELIEAVSVLDRREFTTTDEEEHRRRLAGEPEGSDGFHPRGTGAGGEPAADEDGPVKKMVPFVSDIPPNAADLPVDRLAKRLLAGEGIECWARDLVTSDLDALTLPTSMALVPEDGVCISCSTIPVGGRNNPPRFELRVLVDPGPLGPAGDEAVLW